MEHKCEFVCSCGDKCTTSEDKVKYLSGKFYCDYHFKLFEKIERARNSK